MCSGLFDSGLSDGGQPRGVGVGEERRVRGENSGVLGWI